MPHCPNCGKSVTSKMKFCPNCGYHGKGHPPTGGKQSPPPKNLYSIVWCNACNGTGINSLGYRCFGCKGKKKVKVPNPPTGCYECNRTGINMYGSAHSQCHGTGWMGGIPL
jgi:hypothetical protein